MFWSMFSRHMRQYWRTIIFDIDKCCYVSMFLFSAPATIFSSVVDSGVQKLENSVNIDLTLIWLWLASFAFGVSHEEMFRILTLSINPLLFMSNEFIKEIFVMLRWTIFLQSLWNLGKHIQQYLLPLHQTLELIP